MKPKSIADAALMLLAKKKEEKEQDGPFSWEREKYQADEEKRMLEKEEKDVVQERQSDKFGEFEMEEKAKETLKQELRIDSDDEYLIPEEF